MRGLACRVIGYAALGVVFTAATLLLLADAAHLALRRKNA